MVPEISFLIFDHFYKRKDGRKTSPFEVRIYSDSKEPLPVDLRDLKLIDIAASFLYEEQFQKIYNGKNWCDDKWTLKAIGIEEKTYAPDKYKSMINSNF